MLGRIGRRDVHHLTCVVDTDVDFVVVLVVTVHLRAIDRCQKLTLFVFPSVWFYANIVVTCCSLLRFGYKHLTPA